MKVAGHQAAKAMIRFIAPVIVIPSAPAPFMVRSMISIHQIMLLWRGVWFSSLYHNFFLSRRETLWSL